MDSTQHEDQGTSSGADREDLIRRVAAAMHNCTEHPDYPDYDEPPCGGSPAHHHEAGHEHGSRGVCWACEPLAATVVDDVVAPLLTARRTSTADQGTHVVVTNAPPRGMRVHITTGDDGAIDPQDAAWALRRKDPVTRRMLWPESVTVDDGEPWTPDQWVERSAGNLFLPSLNDPRDRREDAR